MKKLNLLALAFSALAIISCSKEEGNPEPELKNQAVYQDQKFNLSGGVYEPILIGKGSSGNAYTITNGNLTNEEVSQGIYDGSYGIVFSLTMIGSTTLEAGDYVVLPPYSFETIENQYSRLEFYIDSDNDGKINRSKDELIRAKEGNITLSYANNREAISFDVTLQNGETLTGHYNGTTVSPNQLPSNN